MTDITADTAEAPASRPYGLLGLVVSFVAILVGTLLLTAAIAAAIFAVAFLVLGHQQVMDRIVDGR